MVDAMVLIAAAAIAFVSVQYQGLLWILPEKWFPPKNGILRPPEDGDLAALISTFLVPFTVALFALRLRRPRPSRRRLLGQPGFAACAIATTTMVLICLDQQRFLYLVYRKLTPFTLNSLFILNYRIDVSFAPAGLWALMAACGRWHAEPSWIDRAGRIVGTLWILLIPIRWFSPY
jgi:hypothetical protein